MFVAFMETLIKTFDKGLISVTLLTYRHEALISARPVTDQLANSQNQLMASFFERFSDKNRYRHTYHSKEVFVVVPSACLTPLYFIAEVDMTNQSTTKVFQVAMFCLLFKN